jgi:hypothetical protein
MRISATAGLGRFLRLLSPGVLAIAVVGCGGSSSAPSTAASVPAAPASAAGDPSGKPSGATPDEPVVTTVDVGGEAWFAGFHVTFGKATSTIEPNGRGTLTLEATFENTGDESARLDATLTLVSADETARDGFEMDIPRVPGGQTAKGTFAFDVDESFSFDDAVLTLGQPTNQQAIVPLSAKAGMAVSQKPVELNLSGSGKAGSLKLALNGGEIRADSPWKHGQQKKGSLILTVRYDASFESGFAGVRVHGRERRPEAARRHDRRRDPGWREPVDRADRPELDEEGPVLALRDRRSGTGRLRAARPVVRQR